MKLKKPAGRTIIGEVRFEAPLSFTRPAFADTLRFPADITALDAQNISELLGKYTQLLCYSQEQHSRLTVKLIKLESSAEVLQTRIFIANPRVNQIERWRRDQVIKSDLRMIDHTCKIAEVKQQKEIAFAFMQNYDRCINALSRELSRKLASNDGIKHTRLMHRR